MQNTFFLFFSFWDEILAGHVLAALAARGF